MRRLFEALAAETEPLRIFASTLRSAITANIPQKSRRHAWRRIRVGQAGRDTAGDGLTGTLGRVKHGTTAGISHLYTEPAHYSTLRPGVAIGQRPTHKLGGILPVGTIFKTSGKIDQDRVKCRAKYGARDARRILN